MGEYALDDKTTATLFAALVRKTRVVMLCTVGLAAVVWTWALRWPKAARRLLATQPWRETPAMVLNVRGTVLVLPGGEHIRVYGLRPEACEVVIRARRVWLVGPDAAGWLAVRVDGLHTPWPARRVRPRQGAPAGPNGQGIATMWVTNVVASARVMLVAGVCGGVGVVAQAVLPWGHWLSYLSVTCLLFSVGPLWWGLRLVKRLEHDERSWVRAEAVEPVWEARASGLASGTITLAFPDGRWVTAHLRRAPLDLFANVAREKALWVADNGVVGFPHYPIVARARVTPVRSLPTTAERPRATRSPVG